jgi:hypothetical protein
MERRIIEIKVRLSESEMALLNRDVKKSGLSREAYLRSLIRKMPLKERPQIELTEVLHNLRKIGSNLNQIAMIANTKGFVDTAAYWENVRWVQKTVGQIVRGMYG